MTETTNPMLLPDLPVGFVLKQVCSVPKDQYACTIWGKSIGDGWNKYYQGYGPTPRASVQNAIEQIGAIA